MSSTIPTTHVPVMLGEVLDSLNVQAGGRYVDCTLGGAGHAEAILEQAQPGGCLLGIDASAAAIERGQERLSRFGDDSVQLVQGNFRDVGDICRQMQFAPVDIECAVKGNDVYLLQSRPITTLRSVGVERGNA